MHMKETSFNIFRPDLKYTNTTSLYSCCNIYLNGLTGISACRSKACRRRRQCKRHKRRKDRMTRPGRKNPIIPFLLACCCGCQEQFCARYGRGSPCWKELTVQCWSTTARPSRCRCKIPIPSSLVDQV